MTGVTPIADGFPAILAYDAATGAEFIRGTFGTLFQAAFADLIALFAATLTSVVAITAIF